MVATIVENAALSTGECCFLKPLSDDQTFGHVSKSLVVAGCGENSFFKKVLSLYGLGVSICLAIIIPVYNEEANILPLAREVAAAIPPEKWRCELVFVDDASEDGTWRAICDAQRLFPRLRGLRLLRHSGQSAALWTGIQATDSDLIATLDGDLQNDPFDLPRLLAELPRYDFVCGNRTRRCDSFLRRCSSMVAWRARKLVLRVDLADTGCGLRAFKRSALNGLFAFHGLHRFLPLLVHGNGGKVLELPVNHRPRMAGASKYGVWNRLGRGIVDLLAVAWYQRRRIGSVPYEQLPANDGSGPAG
jgi:dolichol-phosphate mannosyltransferase